jgi:alcohol dehydrogenase, propanol-preferring
MPMAVGFTHAREAPVCLERPLGAPGPGEVGVRVLACGLGIADFGFFQLDALPRTPLVPGLEAVGLVEAVGEGVSLVVGTKVGLGPVVRACGRCDRCASGVERWCEGVQLHAWHRDGLLSEHVLTGAERVVPLHAADDAVVMAPLFATGWTALSAVNAAGLSAGQRLGVIGVGGLGHLVVQLARARSLEVAVVDADPARTALGVSLGAEPGLTGPLDAIVVCTPSAQALQLAARVVRRGGVVVLAAASPSVRFDLSLFDTVMRGLSLRPAFLGSRAELEEVVSLYRRGLVVPRVTPLPLAEVPSRFWLLRDGGFEGRLVATPG